MNEDFFIDLMSAAIRDTNGTQSEALAMFELQLLEHDDPRLVWDCFERVRLTTLSRFYRMAQYQIEQASEAQPKIYTTSSSSASGAASEPDEATESPEPEKSPQRDSRHSVVSHLSSQQRRVITPARSRSPRNARSAQGVLVNIGGKQGQYDRLTDHYGHPLSGMTSGGLANFHDENPLVMQYAQLLWEAMPKSDRPGDVVRKFITPDEADRMWLDLLKAVA